MDEINKKGPAKMAVLKRWLAAGTPKEMPPPVLSETVSHTSDDLTTDGLANAYLWT